MATSSSTLAALYNSRFCYGPRFGDTSAPTASNLNAWLTQQTSITADPADIVTRLAAVSLTTQYTDATNTVVTETGPLSTLSMTQADLWARDNANSKDRSRPLEEVRCAYWIRTIWSSAQLRETMVDFWHNHFSVDSSNDSVRMYFPYYDQILRANALGNFHTMLVATAKSLPMLNYLNLVNSTKSNPNENYAREVMELHTLGVAAYLGETTPAGMSDVGYSDMDVTQAARVLTGWTAVKGVFTFNNSWHDTGTKSLLGLTITNNGEAEGETLLQRLATHRATALHIAQKLYVKFVSDVIPANSTLVPLLQGLFMATASSDNQIATLIAAIAESNEFAASAGSKLKTPNELVPSWVRATGSEFETAHYNQLTGMVGQFGAPLFGWPTPNGMPDIASGWLSTYDMLARWRYPETICSPTAGITIGGGLLALAPANNDPAQIPAFVQSLLQSIVPFASAASQAALLNFAQSPSVLGSQKILSKRNVSKGRRWGCRGCRDGTTGVSTSLALFARMSRHVPD